MNIFEFHALSVYLQRNLWHIFSINTLNGETIWHVNYESSKKYTEKPKGRLWNYGETMIRQRYSRVSPCWLNNLPAEVGGTLSSPKKRLMGHFLVPEFDRLFLYSKCCFLFKATRTLCFFSDSNWTWKDKGLRFSQGFKQNWELYIVRGSAQEDKESPSHDQDDELKHRELGSRNPHPKSVTGHSKKIPLKCLFPSELRRVYESKLVRGSFFFLRQRQMIVLK